MDTAQWRTGDRPAERGGCLWQYGQQRGYAGTHVSRTRQRPHGHAAVRKRARSDRAVDVRDVDLRRDWRRRHGTPHSCARRKPLLLLLRVEIAAWNLWI